MTKQTLQDGFKKAVMSDHEFSSFVVGATYKHNGKSTFWVRSGKTIAVVFYDNALMTRDIWVLV